MFASSNFSFIDDDILRGNLDIVFDHVIDLVSLSASSSYSEISKSSFRKTTIIHTASIIEALLLWMLKKNKSEEELSKNSCSFEIQKVIHNINETERIVLGKDGARAEKCKFDKLNLDNINKLCKEHGLIQKDLFDKVDKVRLLRNRMHISTLNKIENDYSKTDLEFVFSVAREVKNFVSAN